MPPNAILVSILILSFFLRVVGLVPGHNPYHPDEPMSYSAAVEMFLNGDLNPRRWDYPAGVPLLHYGIYKTYILPWIIAKNYLLYPRSVALMMIEPNTFLRARTHEIFGRQEVYALFWSRAVTAILGVWAVYLTYVIGKKLFDRSTGLAAALLVAVNWRHVLSSHLALSDIPNNLMALLAVLAAILLWEKKTRGRYLLCGLLVGLSLSMKYQFFSLLPFLVAHLWWVIKERSLRTLLSRDFLLAIVLMPLIFSLLNPYLLLNIKKALPVVVDNVSVRYWPGIWRFNAYAVYYLFNWGIGQLSMLTILSGFLLGVWWRPWQTLLLFSYIGPFLFVFLYYMLGGVYVRNFTTVIPFLAVFGGLVLSSVVSLARRYIPSLTKEFLAILLAILVNLQPFRDSLTLAMAYLKPWNRDELAAWSQKSLPVGSRILNDNLGLPGSLTQFTITPWSHEVGNSLTELMETKYDFAVFNVTENQNNLFWHDDTLAEVLTYRGLPYRRLKDTYAGLLVQEYKDYVIFEKFKPWQAPDDAYLIIKIPRKSIKWRQTAQQFSFTTSADKWLQQNWSVRQSSGGLFWQPTGFNTSGSIFWTGCIRQPYLCRISSPTLPAGPNTLYLVEAMAQSMDKIESDERDGFLRVDFYSRPEEARENQPLKTVLSNRVFGNGWVRLFLVTKSPLGAKYLTLGFQRSRPNSTTPYVLDEVRIIEVTGELSDRFPEIPHIQPAMPDNAIFPNGIY